LKKHRFIVLFEKDLKKSLGPARVDEIIISQNNKIYKQKTKHSSDKKEFVHDEDK